MNWELVLRLEETPVAQPRHSQTVRGGKSVAYVPRGHPVHGYRNAVLGKAIAAREQLPQVRWPYLGPAEVMGIFFLLNPVRMKERDSSWNPSRPDLDNLLKSSIDALKGVIIKDDSQVVSCKALKAFAGTRKPSVILLIRPAMVFLSSLAEMISGTVLESITF